MTNDETRMTKEGPKRAMRSMMGRFFVIRHSDFVIAVPPFDSPAAYLLLF